MRDFQIYTRGSEGKTRQQMICKAHVFSGSLGGRFLKEFFGIYGCFRKFIGDFEICTPGAGVVRELHRTRRKSLRELYESCTEHFGKLYGSCTGAAQNSDESCTGVVGKLHRTLRKAVRELHRPFRKAVRELYGSWTKRLLRFGDTRSYHTRTPIMPERLALHDSGSRGYVVAEAHATAFCATVAGRAYGQTKSDKTRP